MTQPAAPPPPLPVEELTRRISHVLSMQAHFAAALHSLSADLSLPAVVELKKNAEHALAYEQTAAIYRRRAERLAEGPERAAFEERAKYFEERAGIKRAGKYMPRALRTPKEKLDHVAFVREVLLQAYEMIADCDAPDFDAFEAAIVDEKRQRAPAAGSAHEQMMFVESLLRGVLARMGGLFDASGACRELLPVAIELSVPAGQTEAPAAVVTSPAAAAIAVAGVSSPLVSLELDPPPGSNGQA